MIDADAFQWTEYSYQHPDGHFDSWKPAHISRPPLIRRHAMENGLFPLRSVWLYNTPDLQGERIGHYHIDLDGSLEKAQGDTKRLLRILENTYNLPLDMVRLGFSGSKGFNLVIPFPCFLKEVIPEPETVYKRFGEFLRLSCPSIDLGIYSRRRLWKLENSKHPKTGLYRIQLRSEEISLPLQDILAIATKPRILLVKKPMFCPELAKIFEKIQNHEQKFTITRIRKPQNSDFNTLPPEDRIPKKYRHVVSEGNRNPVICQLIGTLQRAGCGYDEAREIVLAFNSKYCSPSKKEEEALIPLNHYY